MRLNIFCPECIKKGYKKKLLEVDSSANGVIYPYCKHCKKNVRIELKRGKAQ